MTCGIIHKVGGQLKYSVGAVGPHLTRFEKLALKIQIFGEKKGWLFF
jgi:hypothetical protein